MENYNDNLYHLAEPDTPEGCEEAVSIELDPWIALWFTEHLEEFGHYGNTSSDVPDRDNERDLQEIALGYSEFIERQVFDRRETKVALYAHTSESIDALFDALYNHIPERGSRDGYPIHVFRRIEEGIAEAGGNYVEGVGSGADSQVGPQSDEGEDGAE